MAEELIKYIAVALIALKTSYIDEPVDFPFGPTHFAAY
jgi:UDP-glucose 6-dehydrogenase